MAGSIEFTPPYQDGWQDNEEGATPITADILNNNYDAFLILLNTWIGNIEEELVAVPEFQISSPSSGQVLKYNGSKWVNANESGGGGGSSVSWQQILQTGTKISTITIDGISYDVYAPTPITNLSGLSDVALSNPSNGQVIQYNSSTSKWENKSISSGDSVSFTQILSSGTKIGIITINGTSYDIYAPSGGGGGGSSVSWNQVQLSGFKIAEVTIDGASQNVYIPNIPANTSDLNNDSNFVADASYVHTDNNYTTTEKNKLADLNLVEANPSSGTSAGNLNSIEIGGTKYDIPSGGGGGSDVEWTQITQSGIKIAEIEIDGSTTNVYAPSGGGGGYTEVTGTLTAGQTELLLVDNSITQNSTLDIYTDQFGVNPTDAEVLGSTYEGQINDILTAQDTTKVTASSNESSVNSKEWKAFDGADGNTNGNSWLPAINDAPCWLQYKFSTAKYISEVKLHCFNNLSGQNYNAPAKIQASNDGTTWTDISESTDIQLTGTTPADITFACDESQAWTYVRLYSETCLLVYGGASCFVGEMEIYGGTLGTPSLKLTFDAQSENLGVKVRVS